MNGLKRGEYVHTSSSNSSQRLSLGDIGSIFGFTYTSRLIFFHEKDLRNYYSWGFDRNACDASSQDLGIVDFLDAGNVIDGLSVRYIGEVGGIDVGYGLFVDVHVRKGTAIGEYVGVVMKSSGPPSSYSFNYPSCDGGYYIEAVEYGNLLRFINHSSRPNCEYKIVFHEGISHIVAVSKTYLYNY
jgi:hypothetical protein